MAAVLPDEVVYQIFSYLDPRSLGAALQCNSTFYRIATSSSLWETPYLLRWPTGDPEREAKRGTDQLKRQRKIQRLEEHARRAAVEKGMPSSSSSNPPFRYLQLSRTSTSADPPSTDSELPAHAQIDFYRLFLERISIDQKVIDILYDQVESTHGRIPAITSLALRFGNDAKDVLTAIVEAQSSCPSQSSNGLSSLTTATSLQNANSRPVRKNPSACDLEDYRVTAYQAHLPTTLRSETHHLVILHHAREMLEHLQRREAMQRMNELGQLADWSPSTPGPQTSAHHFVPSSTESAVSLLAMFRGGEASYVESQLDVLAAACDLYLQQRFSDNRENQDRESSPLNKAKDLATAICDFLADHGFRGARDELFSDLDNHFLHHCFTLNRETLPLSLTLIFCGVANRLGLRASLCNFPMRILAFIMADPSAPLPKESDTLSSATQEMFWLDVCEYTTVAYDAHEPTPEDPFARRASWLQQRPPVLDREDIVEWISRMGIPPSDDFWRPAQPESMVQRAARNILSSVQRAQILPRSNGPEGQARSALRSIERNRRSTRLENQWSNLVRVDHAFLSSFHGRTNAEEHEGITAEVAAALDRGDVDVAEDETIWGIVRNWRSESMRTLTTAPESWVLPAKTPAERFREWMQAREQDNDWTRTRDHLQRRADHWSEHEQQAAKYAAVNAFLRLSTQVNAREVDWIAGFLQSYFMLDVEVIERDFLGFTPSPGTGGAEDEASSEEGSDSSVEASFSAQDPQRGATGFVTNQGARVVLRRMLQAVRAKDGEPPRVNRRSGAEARRQRQARTGDRGTEDRSGEEEDTVGYRVGTIFRHRTYRYAGCILGWDPYCAAPEDWIVNMGVDRLPAPRSTPTSASSCSSTKPPPHTTRERRGGRHQPFYHSQVADGTRRYVAEVNVEPISGPIWIYGTPPGAQLPSGGGEVVEEGRVLGTSLHKMLSLRGLGEYFRCFDQVRGRLRRNTDCRVMFPDDWSDDEEEEVEVEDLTQASGSEGTEERLSEDGSW